MVTAQVAPVYVEPDDMARVVGSLAVDTPLRVVGPDTAEWVRVRSIEPVLALLYLTLHQPGPYLAWKGFEWAALDRLHQKRMIDDPKNKNKSVALTDEAMADAAAAFQRLFSGDGDDG